MKLNRPDKGSLLVPIFHANHSAKIESMIASNVRDVVNEIVVTPMVSMAGRSRPKLPKPRC